MVSLYSASYFSDTDCGLELAVFKARMTTEVALNGEPAGQSLLPLWWRRDRDAPASVAESTVLRRLEEPLGKLLGADYLRFGLYELMRTRTEYSQIVDQIAACVLAANAARPPELPVADLGGITPLFGAPRSAPVGIGMGGTRPVDGGILRGVPGGGAGLVHGSARHESPAVNDLSPAGGDLFPGRGRDGAAALEGVGGAWGIGRRDNPGWSGGIADGGGGTGRSGTGRSGTGRSGTGYGPTRPGGRHPRRHPADGRPGPGPAATRGRDAQPDVPKADVPKADVPQLDVPRSDVPRPDLSRPDASPLNAPRSEVPRPSRTWQADLPDLPDLPDRTYSFFLSYPTRTDADHGRLERFHRDLEAWVRTGGDRRADHRGFLARVSIEGGELWRDTLVDATRTSAVMIALMSDDLFTSGWCGWEWAVFSAREERSVAGGRRRPGIIPIHWAAARLPPPSAVAQRQVFGVPVTGGRPVVELMLDQQRYERFVSELGSRVLDLLARPLPSFTAAQAMAIAPAFGGSASFGDLL